MRSEKELANIGSGSSGDGDGNKRADADLGHHDFHGEENAADGSIEGGSNTAASTRSDENETLPDPQTKNLANRGAEGSADLDDGTFAADRAATPDGDSRGEGFDQSNDGTDNAFTVIDGLHDLRNAVPFSFRGEIADEESNTGSANHRNQDDSSTPGSERSMNIGVIAGREFPEEEEIVNEGDEGTKAGGAEPSDDTDEDGEQPECGRRQVAASRRWQTRTHSECPAKKASPSGA